MSPPDHTPPPGARLRFNILRRLAHGGLKDEYLLILLSLVVGAATGVFAHLFYVLIESASRLAYGHKTAGGLFGGRLWMVVVLPTVGALLVGVLTRYFASEARGHGVPEVMDAIYRKGGTIRPRVAGVKAIASALTIGSGGSAGMEGPIIQIGGAVGSSVGQFLHVPPRQMNIMVACGVSAGIAAIFNAPIAGVLFALEVFLKDFSFRTFSPVVFSSVISCSIMHALSFGEDRAIFQVAAGDPYHFVVTELPYFLVLGVLCAGGAVAFIRLLYATEDLIARTRIPLMLQPVIGAVGLGLVGAAFLAVTRESAMPPFFANGYPIIKTILSSRVLDLTIGFLFALCTLKIIATCMTLGTGGSGGIFAPSLLMGASIGGAFGLLLARIGIIDHAGVPAYALVGMAALVAGTTHAPLTAIVMLWEITRESRVILPVMFAAIVATFGAQFLSRDSIYTLKLRRRGVRVGSMADLTLLRRITAADVDKQPAHFVLPDDPLQLLIDMAGETDAVAFVVVDEQEAYQGMVRGRDVRTALLQPEAVSLLVVADLLSPGVPTVRPGETLDIVLDKFAGNEVESLPICREGDDAYIEGLITHQAVMRRYHQELDRQTG